MDYWISILSLFFYAAIGASCFYFVRRASAGRAPSFRHRVAHGKPLAMPSIPEAPHPSSNALRSALIFRVVDSPAAIDDMADDILRRHPGAMALRDYDIYKGPFPSYAVAIPDAGLGFDIRLIDFDARGALSQIEQAVLTAAAVESAPSAVQASTRKRL